MKRTIYFFTAALAVVGVASCTNKMVPDTISNPVMEKVTFSASVDEGTKVVLGTDLNVNWSSEDSIAVWDGTQYNVFKLVSGAGTTSAVFSGEVTPGATDFYAVSPFTAAKGFEADSSKILLSIPAGQYPPVGGVDPSALVSIAKADKGCFAFKNVVGLIKVNVAGSGYSKVKFTTESNVAGSYYCGIDGSRSAKTPKFNLAIYPQEGQETVTPGSYYVACAPETVKSVKIRYVASDGMKVKGTTKILTVGRSKVTEIAGDESLWPLGTGIELSGLASTSSTITVKWLYLDKEDVTRDYKASLYKNAECTDLELAFDLPASLNVMKSSGKPAAFCFAGLNPSTTYYVKISDKKSGTSTEPVAVTTSPAFAKTLPVEEPVAGDIILQEDFSELIYGCDVINYSPGYCVTNDSDGFGTISEIKKASGDNPEGYKVVVYNKSYYIGTVFTDAVKATRLKDWAAYPYASHKKVRYYGLAGYINAGASNYPVHVALPEMDCLKKNAKLEVSFSCVYWPASDGNISVGTMDKGATIDMSSASKSANYRITKCTEHQAISFPVTAAWADYKVEIEDVAPGSRVYIGGNDLNARVLLDNIQIKVLSY